MAHATFPGSSNITAADYNEGTLTIHYKSGGSYTYHNVPEHHWAALQSATSAGKYIHEHIKSNFTSKRV